MVASLIPGFSTFWAQLGEVGRRARGARPRPVDLGVLHRTRRRQGRGGEGQHAAQPLRRHRLAGNEFAQRARERRRFQGEAEQLRIGQHAGEDGAQFRALLGQGRT